MSKAEAYAEVAKRAKELAAAQAASEKAAAVRGNLDVAVSRARMTTANARWMRAAEDRDRKLTALDAALAAAGLQ